MRSSGSSLGIGGGDRPITVASVVPLNLGRSGQSGLNLRDGAVAALGAGGQADGRIAAVAGGPVPSSALMVYYLGAREGLLAEAPALPEERFNAATALGLGAHPAATGQLRRLIEL